MKIEMEIELTKEQIEMLFYHFNLKQLKQNNYELLLQWLFENDYIYQAHIKEIKNTIDK